MTYRVLTGDCRETLKALGAGTVQCVVTSPPYWGLRSYLPEGSESKGLELGAEATPDEYVANMVTVFREVWRVLRDDGVCWLNLGDSFARDGGPVMKPGVTAKAGNTGNTLANVDTRGAQSASVIGLKPKDLVGIPWRVAFALQADGWYLRQDVIWSKGNPMPESVTDRCTRSHEYLFMLTKSARYFYDADAIREGAVQPDRVRFDQIGGTKGVDVHHSPGGMFEGATTRNRRSVWTVNSYPYSGAHFAVMPPLLVEPCILAGSREGDTVLDPFGGSGTVGMVARWHGRDAVLCELNPEYVGLMEERISMERTETGGARKAAPVVGGGASIDLLGDVFGA